MPNVPTMTESGYKNLSSVAWSGIFGPAKMSPTISALLSKNINALMQHLDVQQAFAKQGFESKGSTPAELGHYVKEQLRAWGTSIEMAGLISD